MEGETLGHNCGLSASARPTLTRGTPRVVWRAEHAVVVVAMVVVVVVVLRRLQDATTEFMEPPPHTSIARR